MSSWNPFSRNSPFVRPQPPTDVNLQPIALVRNNIKKPRPSGWENIKSIVEVKPEYVEYLHGIEGYSHIILVCYLDLAANAPEKPSRIEDVGIFATRSQLRPNHLAVSSVKLLNRAGNKLVVEGLDVIDNTPVLDIKPYLPFYDAFADAEIPTD